MFTIAEDPDVILQAQDMMQDQLESSATDCYKITIGRQGYSGASEVLWSDELGIWMDFVELDNRFWNAFGTYIPEEYGNANITCEINFPLKGINRRIAGAVATAKNGPLLIVHRGKIGGGRRGIGKQLFERHYRGEWVTFQDGDRESRLALIGHLGDDKFPLQVATFVKEVERIKQLVYPTCENASAKAEIEPTDDQQMFQEEFAGEKGYTLQNEIIASCDHGLIVNALAQQIADLGAPICNDRFRDLMVLDDSGIPVVIFEVKTSWTSTNIYTLIGQLFYHRVNFKSAPKLVAVLPNDAPATIRKRLRALKILTLTYELEEKAVRFLGLKRLWRTEIQPS